MLKTLDAAAVRRWAATCCHELAAHREEIDGLNVFPVPDQDTGSNLLATMRAGLEAVLREGSPDGVAAATAAATAAALARGALRGARGNSGVIVSQVLRGFAESFADGAQAGAGPRGGAVLREGLRRAEELATAAVSEPVSGTVLTVLHAAAAAAARVRSDDLCDVAAAAAAAAACALAETPRQLAVLARAGVVDAGGQGLVLLLEALLTVVTERPGRWSMISAPAARPAAELRIEREDGSAEYEYEVMYLLDGADEAAVATLRAELGGLGDCVAVVGSGEAVGEESAALWNVHVHCSDIGAAIEAGMRAGRPHHITVVRFADQGGTAEPQRCAGEHVVLVMVSGSGLAELFRAEGAVLVRPDCTVPELLEALSGTRAGYVTVLAAPGAAAEVAEVAAARCADTGPDVVVVPTVSPVQALAALAVHVADQRAVDDRRAMAEAVAATRCGELSVAQHTALPGGCRPGELVGTLDGEVVLIERDPQAAAFGLVDRMLDAGGELLTVVVGQQAPDGLGQRLAEYLREEYPDVEAVVYQGGQPDSVLLAGVE